MNILGIIDNHDAGAALIVNNAIVSAVNEERLNRIKNYTGFPYLSIKCLFKIASLKPEQIDKVVVGSAITPSFFLRIFPKLHMSHKRKLSSFGIKLTLYTLYQVLAKRIDIVNSTDRILSKIILAKKLKKLGIFAPISLLEHHFTHAQGAYITSPFREALVITFDAIGDGLSVTVNSAAGGKIIRLFQQYGSGGAGYHYSRVTEILGFKPNNHEGKIMGLAAYGNPFIRMKNYFRWDGNNFVCIYKSKRAYLRLKKFKKEDVAASAQNNFEEEVCRFVRFWLIKTGLRNLCLSGGIFSNVKLNQKIHELDEVDNIYVYPHMGDGGLALGAVVRFAGPGRLSNLYLGPEYTDAEIERILKKNNLAYEEPEYIEKNIARLLKDGQIVCRFSGRMEFGPRALGNRSILAPAGDQGIREILNRSLKRDHFMPFAPVIMKGYADRFCRFIEGAENSAVNMTISFNCNKDASGTIPAVVHADNTARPQILDERRNPAFYRILSEYHRLTGAPVLLNTSFNIHEEPVVSSPEDAVRNFKKSGLKYLAIGRFLVKH